MNTSVREQKLDSLLLRLSTSEKIVFLPVEECRESLGENYTEVLEKNDLIDSLTCLQHSPTLTNSALIKAVVLSIMTIISLIGNIATIYSIQKFRRRRSGHMYTLLLHLSIADLFVTFWCMLGDAVWYFTVEWKAGNLECKLFKFAQMTSLYISTFIMVLIGVDRLIAVRYPLKFLSKGMFFRLVLFCWFLSGFLSSPQIFVFNVLSGPFQEPFYQCVTYGSYNHDWQEKLYTIFTVAFTFIIPLMILTTTYLLTFYTLHRNQDLFENTEGILNSVNPKRRTLIRRAKIKSIRISVAIVATFVICWTPYYVAMIYTFINRRADHEMENPDSIIFTIIFFFGVSNSICNPVIYGYFHHRKPQKRKNTSNKNTNYSVRSQRSTTLNVTLVVMKHLTSDAGIITSLTDPASVRLLSSTLRWKTNFASHENTDTAV